ncbi:MAG: Rne/Rng family ribonuclease [Ornithinimicrobium sp.]
MSTTDDASQATPNTDQKPAVQPPSSAGFGLVFQAPDLSEVAPRKPRPRAKPADGEAKSDSSQTDQGNDADSPSRGTSTGKNAAKGKSPKGGEGKGEGASEPASSGGSSSSSGGQEPEETASHRELAASDSADSGGPTSREGSSGNRRRKRGGKGRRGRGQGGEGSTTDSDESSDDGGRGSVAADSDTDSSAQNATSGSGKQGSSGGGGSSGKRKSGGKQGSAAAGDLAGGPGESSGAGTDQGNDERGPSEGAGADDDSGKRRRRRRRGDSPERGNRDEVTSVRGSTRLEAKRQRRNQGREVGRRRTVISEAEFLARRESVERVMLVRGLPERTQIAVLEDGVPVEHYVSQQSQSTTVGNVYLGRVQNVLPSMEAAFVDIGKGRNAVLYAGEVNWDAAGLEVNQAKRIENALTSGESVLVQVTKDPIGHKGARLTSQVSLPGRFLVYVPGSSMTGISRKLPDTERSRLKKILKEVVPDGSGVIVRTAAEGASEAELRADVERLQAMWEAIEAKSASKAKSASGPVLLHSEPDMTVRVIRDVFNEDFAKLIVSGDQAWEEVSQYLEKVAPDLSARAEKWTGTEDIFTPHRVNEALAKAMDRKVWLPSGGSLVIDRTEAMTVVDVNTGKFVGSGGNLEETVTKNNIEAAEEIVRQLRLRDIGGIIVIDFIDMVLEANRELVVRRLLECLGRDRTKHQVAEVTSLGLVQMTRKRVGAGLIEVFSEQCAHCNGRGLVVHSEPVEKSVESNNTSGRGRSGRKSHGSGSGEQHKGNGNSEVRTIVPSKTPTGPTPAQIAAAAHAAALQAGTAEEAAVAATAAARDVATDGVEQSTDTDEQIARTDDAADGVEQSTDTDEQIARTDDAANGVEQSTDTEQQIAPRDAVHQSSRSDQGHASDAEQVAVTQPANVAAAPRPRRRRGRVVAPAGPPSGS